MTNPCQGHDAMTPDEILDYIREADSLARQHRCRHAVVDRTGRVVVLPWQEVRQSDVVLETVRPVVADRFGRAAP